MKEATEVVWVSPLYRQQVNCRSAPPVRKCEHRTRLANHVVDTTVIVKGSPDPLELRQCQTSSNRPVLGRPPGSSGPNASPASPRPSSPPTPSTQGLPVADPFCAERSGKEAKWQGESLRASGTAEVLSRLYGAPTPRQGLLLSFSWA